MVHDELFLAFDAKQEFSEFVQALAAAYCDEMTDHGYQPPPYGPKGNVTGRGPCCTLPMMWRALERIKLIKLVNDEKEFRLLHGELEKPIALADATGEP